MIRGVQRILGGLAVLVTALCTSTVLTGCAADPPAPAGATKTTLFVPGVFGDGANYNGLRKAIAIDGSAVHTVTWGLPKLLFIGNFSGQAVHDEAETKLAGVIDATKGEIDLVGHSAGCGVILGSLAKCHRKVNRVVLIAPSVSPTYDTTPALDHADVIHYFSSERDTFFLKWRCGTFGTYDRIKTPAAGYAGFAVKDPKLVEHPYDPVWERYGNGGGHSDGIGGDFVKAVVLPLLRTGDQPR
ncbi:MAG: hypothetical protein JWM57_4323 [Phycisphaerales bacterium]|nr:hypothetical protein [Phycisphaerales bacterium]